MRSDVQLTEALGAMARPIAEFRAMVEGAIDRAETFLVEQAANDQDRATRAAAELGRFAAGRIDPSRFAALFPTVPPAGSDVVAVLHRATGVLRTLVDRADAAFVVDLPDGGRLAPTVGDRLADIGQSLGAITLVDLIRGGRYQPAEHDRLLEPLDFSAWTKVQRRRAPPVIVSLAGSDLHAGGLSDYADGRAKIVLVVRGGSAPAPLARCISPGTLVLQTTDGSGLDRVATFDGPALAAIMPDGAATFLHDPGGGRESWQRLTVSGPGTLPKRSIGGASVWQMAEDQALLSELARTPFAIPTGSGPAAPAVGAADAVDRIASWLLGQTGLTDR